MASSRPLSILVLWRAAISALVAASSGLIVWRIASLKVMLGGSVFGIVRDRVCELPGVRSVLCASVGGR